jgi:hypothetical protein
MEQRFLKHAIHLTTHSAAVAKSKQAKLFGSEINVPIIKHYGPLWARPPLKTHLEKDNGMPRCGEGLDSPTTKDREQVTCEKCLAHLKRYQSRVRSDFNPDILAP